MSSPDLMSNRKLSLLAAVRNQTPNNLHDALNAIVSKNAEDDEDMLALKNLNETSSSYKPFGDDLYYGVNLNTNLTGVYKAKRCSCYLDPEYDAQFLPPPATRPRPASTSFLPTQQLIALTSSPRAKFSHRNIRLSPEDCQNLENEARQHKSYTKYSIYDTSFWKTGGPCTHYAVMPHLLSNPHTPPLSMYSGNVFFVLPFILFFFCLPIIIFLKPYTIQHTFTKNCMIIQTQQTFRFILFSIFF